MQTFRSKIDFGLMAFIFGCLIVPAYLSWGDAAAMRVSFIVTAAVVVLLVRLITATKYVISNDTLVVHNGFYKIKVPLESITSVKPTGNASASPALSLDRLRIEYGQNKSVLISPKDKTGFLAAISQN